jgi:hypothetical protein
MFLHIARIATKIRFKAAKLHGKVEGISDTV